MQHPYVCDHDGAVVVPPRQATDAAHEMRIADLPEGAKRTFWSKHYSQVSVRVPACACVCASH